MAVDGVASITVVRGKHRHSQTPHFSIDYLLDTNAKVPSVPVFFNLPWLAATQCRQWKITKLKASLWG